MIILSLCGCSVGVWTLTLTLTLTPTLTLIGYLPSIWPSSWTWPGAWLLPISSLSKKIHSQYFSGCKYISMEWVALDQFNKLKPYTIPMDHFNSHLCDKSDQDDSTTATNIHIILQLKFFYISSLDNHVGSHGWLHKSVSLCIWHLSTIMTYFIIFYYWHSSRITCKRKICDFWSEW